MTSEKETAYLIYFRKFCYGFPHMRRVRGKMTHEWRREE